MSKTLTDEIITIVKSEANNNPAPERCRVIKVYPDKIHVDVQTNLGELRYVDVIGSNPCLGDNAVILYLTEDFSEYVVIADTENIGRTSDIIETSALDNLGTSANATQHDINLKINEKINQGGGGSTGVVMVGSFRINDDGDLIVTLPTGTLNPYYIDDNGDLIYSTNPQIQGGT